MVSRARLWLAPALALLAVVCGIVAVLALAQRAATPDTPPEPAAFAAPAPVRPNVALDVQQAAGGRLALSDGTRDVGPAPGARVETLRPETLENVRPGDWLAVIGVPNEVRTFAIRSLVLIDGGGAPDTDGNLRSPGGFAGHEAARDQSERPILGGVVERVDGRSVTLRAPVGSVTITVAPNAPLRRLVPSSATEIREGDRVGFPEPASKRIDDAAAVLVLPDGAR